MTEATAVPRGLSVAAFVLGLASLVLVFIFIFSSAGASPVVGGVACGIAAIVVGIIALTKRQPKALALTGLIIGSIVTLLGLALIIFALLFVGAISLGMA